MANDKVAIWGNQLVFGRKTANGELLIGNGEGFTLATLTAGAGASITNAAGVITISASGTGITSVTASSPLASSGGSMPDISLSGTIAVGNGGTGATTLTSNNVILGNGTSAVQFVAPGSSGNILTSNGTTWTSAAPANKVLSVFKSSDQSTNSSTTLFNDSELFLNLSANKKYAVESILFYTAGGGGLSMALSALSGATGLVVNVFNIGSSGTSVALGAAAASGVSATTGTPALAIQAYVSTGSTGGNLYTMWTRATASGTTTVKEGSYMTAIEN